MEESWEAEDEGRLGGVGWRKVGRRRIKES